MMTKKKTETEKKNQVKWFILDDEEIIGGTFKTEQEAFDAAKKFIDNEEFNELLVVKSIAKVVVGPAKVDRF